MIFIPIWRILFLSFAVKNTSSGLQETWFSRDRGQSQKNISCHVISGWPMQYDTDMLGVPKTIVVLS